MVGAGTTAMGTTAMGTTAAGTTGGTMAAAAVVGMP